jgi:DNA repair protein RecO (recombination protein O)
MLIKTRGIVFKTLKYGESSIIADIYTEEFGLKKYIFGGVRSKKPIVKPGLLQLMSILDLLVYEKQGVSLQRVKETSPAWIYATLPFDLVKSSIGIFILEVCRKTLRQSLMQSEVFNFLYRVFTELDQGEALVSTYHLHFMVNYCRILGFMPQMPVGSSSFKYFDLREGIFTNTLPDHFDYLRDRTVDHLSEFLAGRSQFARSDKQELLESLIRYIELQTDTRLYIQSHLILREIL